MESLNLFAMSGPADWFLWPIVYIPSTNVSAPQLARDLGLSDCLATGPKSFRQVERAPIKRRIRLKNAKLPRQQVQTVVKSRWRLQNRSLPKPLSQIAHLVRTCTWDKAPLENDVEIKPLLEQANQQQWESDSTHASDCESDSHSLPSEHQDVKDLEDIEEGWDAIIAWVHGNLPSPRDAADPSDVEARFHGVWGPASIEKSSLVWNEGEIVKIDIVSETQFSMTYYCDPQYAPRVFAAELRGDGKLYWSDGDVWSRRPAPCTVDTSAPRVLPPWLQKCSRRSRRYEPVTSSHGEPRVVFGHGSDAAETNHQRADNESHASGSSPCVVSIAASDDIPVALARICQDTQSTDRNRNCSKADRQTHVSSSSPCVVVCKSMSIAETAPKCQETILSGPHKGFVKWFRGSYGWVDCAGVTTKYNDCDIFLHVNDCDFRPRQGDTVEFFVAPGDMGNPKAVRVTQAKAVEMTQVKAAEIINGRDYFAARDAKLAMRRRT
jgi:hypothetical protein